MGIQEVIVTQAKLLEAWKSDRGKSLIWNYARETKENPQVAYTKMVRELNMASPILVVPEICDLIEFGERSFPEQFTLKREDIPVESGFAKFEKPLWLPLIPEDQDFPSGLQVGYVVWRIEAFIDKRDNTEWDALWYTFYSQDPFDPRTPLGTYHSAGWMFGANQDWSILNHSVNSEKMSPEAQAVVKLSTRYLMCFFRFLSTRVIEGSPESIKNHGVRRKLLSDKKLKIANIPDVYVVRLRRVEKPKCLPGTESRSVNWSHRWPVGAHWRDQFYPSTNEHRPLWIETYVKGPEDKPLIAKRGYKVDR